MIDYDIPLYRPPAEAYNVIIQVTLGCSFNKCAFCVMYEEKKYTLRKLDDIFDDIEVMAKIYPDTTRVFLADGDALNVDTVHLIKILKFLKEHFTKLQRVSSYASPYNLLEKTQSELNELKDNGLSLIYYGIESGNYELLKLINKPIKPEKMVKGLNKATKAGMKISATVILGLGGKTHSKAHIEDTIELVNACEHINYFSTLQLMLEEHKEDSYFKRFEDKKSQFIWMNDLEMLEEQQRLIKGINPKKPLIFRSNHASNSLPLKGTLPKNKEALLETIARVIKSNSGLVDKNSRGF